MQRNQMRTTSLSEICSKYFDATNSYKFIEAFLNIYIYVHFEYVGPISFVFKEQMRIQLLHFALSYISV